MDGSTGIRILKAFATGLLILLIIGAIGATVLIHRGFRATAKPPRLEAVLARTARNLAIPRTERNQKNPFEPASDTMQQGREYFLNQCAACHGIDGSGRTQVGLNLYPRVPDLHEAATQSLTDGELHYIIENGVPLTGMPAWANPHGESSSNSWKLVLFIRTLRSLNRQETSQQAMTAGSAHYVGSQACKKCHVEICGAAGIASGLESGKQEPAILLSADRHSWCATVSGANIRSRQFLKPENSHYLFRHAEQYR